MYSFVAIVQPFTGIFLFFKYLLKIFAASLINTLFSFNLGACFVQQIKKKNTENIFKVLAEFRKDPLFRKTKIFITVSGGVKKIKFSQQKTNDKNICIFF